MKRWMRIACSLVWCLATTLWAQEDNTAPTLILEDTVDGHELAEAMQLSMAVEGEINGMIASITIHQTYKNPTDEWVNGRYVFPLPPKAAVNGLNMVVDGRTIRAQVKEREEAQNTFIEAKSSGKKAALLEQERPNLFSMQVANIPPHGEVSAEVHFIMTAHYDNGTFSLALPTTLTPRYIPQEDHLAVIYAAHQHDDFGDVLDDKSSKDVTFAVDGHGWALNTLAVPDASRITPPQTRDVADTSHRYSLNIKLNSGLALANIRGSQSLTQRKDGDAVHLSLAQNSAAMDADFVLNWQPVQDSRPRAAIFSEKRGEQYYQMLMFVPPTAKPAITEEARSISREVIFVIDSSGSMAGESMRGARKGLYRALASLHDKDTFNVIDFDDTAKPLFSAPQPVTQENMKAAQKFITQLDADGGTNIMDALDSALAQSSKDESRLSQIIFLTDGSVGNEKEIFTAIRHRLGHARLFTVGIGSAPNRYFMEKAAQHGRGTYTYIKDGNISREIDTLMSKIASPVVTNLTLDFHQHNVENYPEKLPDLYSSEPLLLFSRSDKPINEIDISGTLAMQPWQRNIQTIDTNHNANIGTLWARHKIDNINDSYKLNLIDRTTARRDILPLALQYQLMSEFTSFVAVEEKISRPSDEDTNDKNVPNLMPQGSTMSIPIPQTATLAQLYQWLGALLLLLSLLLHWRRRAA